jgi:sporulation protein YpjB
MMVKGGCLMINGGMNRLRMSALLLMLMIFGTACGSTAGQADTRASEQIRKMEFLNQTANEMYKEVTEGQVVEARNKLLQLSDQITRIQFEGVTSIEGLNALTETITQAKRVFNAASYTPEEGNFAAAKVRLATDALIHTNQPMWQQYYKVLNNDIDSMEQGLSDNKKELTIEGFNRLVQHISLIKPALFISREPSEIEKLDSLILFVRNELSGDSIQIKNVQNGILNLQAGIDELFERKKDATAYLPMIDTRQPILWSLGIGAIIISVLTFAGWRMFRSGRNVIPVKHIDEG